MIIALLIKLNGTVQRRPKYDLDEFFFVVDSFKIYIFIKTNGSNAYFGTVFVEEFKTKLKLKLRIAIFFVFELFGTANAWLYYEL